MRYLFFVALCMFSVPASSAETRWLALNMELGCVPLTDLYAAYPELTGLKTPEQILKVLEKNHTNVRSRPALDLVDDEAPPDADNDGALKARMKLMTKSNALFISWGTDKDGDGFSLYTENLCKAFFRRR